MMMSEKEIDVKELKQFDCIGELDYFGNKNLKYSARANEDSDVFILEKDKLKHYFCVEYN